MKRFTLIAGLALSMALIGCTSKERADYGDEENDAKFEAPIDSTDTYDNSGMDQGGPGTTSHPENAPQTR